MNSKQVLDRIVSMLSLTKKEEVAMTYARLADGTIVESPTFDVGEPVEVVSEDGTKTPAPDGEHELVLRDTEGNEVPFKVITKDGVITERENVELEMVDVKPIPSATMEPEANKVTDPKSPAQNDKGLKTSSMLAEVEELPTGDGIEGTPDPMPGEEGSPFDMKKMYEDMAYRIEEMEKRIAKMEEIKEGVEVEVEEEEEMEKLPKLDGAPIEEAARFSAIKPKNKLKESNPQGSFLEKLYK
jgi:hypothetical protein